jgi:hypothetical protein
MFERLATQVLRRADKNYEAIIHFGINAEGKTIPSPKDGFCLIPGSSPPHFLWVQHTTTASEQLERKWLNEAEDALGDLIKAGCEAGQMKEDFPDARFTVILSTNQRLPALSGGFHRSGKKDLAQVVYARAQQLGLAVIFWEQSRYADFLDTRPEGHWLRKEFFGTCAEMLSEELLAEICRRSLELYRGEQFTSPETWVSRTLDGYVQRAACGVEEVTSDQTAAQTSVSAAVKPREPCTLELLVGESGTGKSAAAYRFLAQHLANGGRGLYVPTSAIQDSVSLENALDVYLHGLYPNLLPDSARFIPQLIPPNSRFLIVVDDVSRANNPEDIIRKLLAWRRTPYLFVSPLRRQLYSEQSFGKQPGVMIIDIDPMSAEEGRRAVEAVTSAGGRTVSMIEAYEIAARLAYDPLLIGSFGKLLANQDGKDLNALAEDTLGQLVDSRMREAARVSLCLPYECRQSLQVLTSHMLQEGTLYPIWQDVERWMQNQPDHLAALRAMCLHSGLCQLSDEGEFRFTHDRLWEYFAVESIVGFLPSPLEHKNVLYDPYYAEMVGQALLRMPQSEATLNHIREQAPLALVSAIRFMGVPSSDYHALIIKKTSEWVRYRGEHSSPESVRAAVANSFIQTDSPAVLDIVHTSFGPMIPMLGDLARFRNGDARSGARYCQVMVSQSRNKASLWEYLVEHARQHHRERLAVELAQVLKTPADRELEGAISLAGFLGLPELQESLAVAWEQLAGKPKHMVRMLWATFKCSLSGSANPFLDSVVAYWASLPDTKTDDRPEYQVDIAKELGTLLPPDADQPLVDCLIAYANQYETLRVPVGHICGLIDLPDSVEFAARACAEAKRELISLEWHWASFDYPRLSSPSLERLQGLWSTEGNSDAIRILAFNVWTKNADPNSTEVLGIIREVPPEAPFLCDAVWTRAVRSDFSCLPDFIKLLESQSRAFLIAPRLWCEQLTPVVRQRLSAFEATIPRDHSGGWQDEHFHLAEMLMEIPVEEAEGLLLEYWSHLQYSPLFVQSALFVGTERCLAAAQTAIDHYPAGVDLFKYLDQHFGHGFSLPEKRALMLRDLQNLQPYLHRFDEYLLNWYAGVCEQLGAGGIELGKKYLPAPFCIEWQKRVSPTEEDLAQDLDRSIIDLYHHWLSFWLDGFRKRGDTRDPLDIVAIWLRDEPTLAKLNAAAWCIQRIGTRKDLAILDVPFKNSTENWLADETRASTTFAVCRRTLT